MKLGEVLRLANGNLINIENDTEYTIAGVQNRGAGVLNKRKAKGKELTMKKYQLIEENQLMWCKVDTKSGAFGVTQKENVGSLASTNMALAYIDESKCLPEFISQLFKFKPFHENITRYSSGSTNRKYLTPRQLFEFIEIPSLTIEEQKKWIHKLNSVQNSPLFTEVDYQLELVGRLRNAFLREAMQGKLVPQDPNDEPASVLLEKIKAEKEKLFSSPHVSKGSAKVSHGSKTARIKKQKPLPEIKPEEIPFEIPNNWTWYRFPDVLAIQSDSLRRGPFGSSITKDMFVPSSDSSTKVYEQKNAIYKNFELGNYFIELQKHRNLNSFLAGPGDILISCAGTIGETYLLPENAPIGIINQALLKIRLNTEVITNEYFINFFKNSIKDKVNEDAKGTAMKNLSSIKYLKSNLIIPLPPLAEQKRIVEKIEKLMAYCDELETNIRESKQNAETLLQVALKEALEPET